MTRCRSFDEFWPYYLREHARPATRMVHIVGTGLAACVLVVSVLAGPWWLALTAPLIGYGFAWTSHLFIEKNRPATFSHPVWSLRGDLRLAWLALLGRLGTELERQGLDRGRT